MNTGWCVCVCVCVRIYISYTVPWAGCRVCKHLRVCLACEHGLVCVCVCMCAYIYIVYCALNTACCYIYIYIYISCTLYIYIHIYVSCTIYIYIYIYIYISHIVYCVLQYRLLLHDGWLLARRRSWSWTRCATPTTQSKQRCSCPFTMKCRAWLSCGTPTSCPFTASCGG